MGYVWLVFDLWCHGVICVNGLALFIFLNPNKCPCVRHCTTQSGVYRKRSLNFRSMFKTYEKSNRHNTDNEYNHDANNKTCVHAWCLTSVITMTLSACTWMTDVREDGLPCIHSLHSIMICLLLSCFRFCFWSACRLCKREIDINHQIRTALKTAPEISMYKTRT